jgi:two-component system, sensor histidine kinase and response regulator
MPERLSTPQAGTEAAPAPPAAWFAHAPDALFVLDADGGLVDGNQAFAALLGHRPADLPALLRWTWDIDLGAAQARAWLDQLAAGDGTPVSRRARWRRADGGQVQVDLRLQRLQGSAGGFIGSGRALPESDAPGGLAALSGSAGGPPAIETALRASEARHRATFENSAVGMAENALDGSWLNVNPRLCEITGYSREALLALDVRLLTHPDDRVDEWPQLRRLLRGELPYARREKRYLRADGSTIWVAVSTSAVRDAVGRGLYFVSVIEDTTERRRIEAELAQHRLHLEAEVAQRTEALQKSEHFLRSVADNIPDMIGYWDAGRVLRFANRSWRDWFSPAADPVGRHRDEVLPAADRAAADASFEAAMGGRRQRFERVLTSPAGEVRYALGHYIPDRQGDRVVGLFVLLADISEAKQAELRLQAMNDAAGGRARPRRGRQPGQERLPGQHEPRDPHADERHHRPDPPDAREAGPACPAPSGWARSDDAAHHLLSIINDVLDLSKIEAGKLRAGEGRLPDRCGAVARGALVAERGGAKGLELVLQSDGVPTLLRGDPTRLSQALLNLLSNAVKFTDRGSIVLRCELHGGRWDGLLAALFGARHRHGHRRPSRWPTCSAPSSRPTPRPPGASAAPAWAWPSRGGWHC